MNEAQIDDNDTDNDDEKAWMVSRFEYGIMEMFLYGKGLKI